MAAGQGFKTFTTGEVLTAGDVNGYLMQGINVFTNATARDAAITAPAEGQFAFTKDNNSLWYYDGAAWVASGATGDIEGVTAGVGISGGGTSGTVTVTNSMATAIDAKGDLVPGTGADTFARLAVGANGTVLTADSTAATGLKWAAPASGGGMTVIASGSLSGSSLSLTSIPATYNNLQLVVRDFTFSATITNVKGTVNSVTGYTNTGNYSDNGTAGTFAYSGLSWIQLVEATIAAAQTDSALIMNIYDYTDTTAYKLFDSYSHTITPASGFFGTKVSGAARGTAAISSVTITLVGGTFSTGTYTLYGVK